MKQSDDLRRSPLYQCWCKATASEDLEPRYSHNWVLARRAQFLVFDNMVKCGDWCIPFDDVQEAIVYHTRQWFIPLRILKLVTKDASYQFGFNPWAKPIEHLAVEYSEQTVRLGYSPFSIAIRVGILVWLAYEGWRYFQ